MSAETQAKIRDTRRRCPCGWEGWESHMERTQVFLGTREEPPEWETVCPECNRPWDETEEVPLCAVCSDVYVQEEDDTCGACLGDRAEEAAARRNQHKFMSGIPGCYGGGYSEGE